MYVHAMLWPEGHCSGLMEPASKAHHWPTGNRAVQHLQTTHVFNLGHILQCSIMLGCTSTLAVLFCCWCLDCIYVQLPRSVSALACKGDLTFAAAGGLIHEAKRSHA